MYDTEKNSASQKLSRVHVPRNPREEPCFLMPVSKFTKTKHCTVSLENTVYNHAFTVQPRNKILP